MVFSKEDKSAWLNSEVMKEFEKFATEVFDGPPREAFEGLEEESFEDENFEEALEEFEDKEVSDEEVSDEEIKKELLANKLLDNLQKLSSLFAEKSNIKTAYRIEQTVCELKDCFGGKK